MQQQTAGAYGSTGIDVVSHNNVPTPQTNLEELLPKIDNMRASIFQQLSSINQAKRNTLLIESNAKERASLGQRIEGIRKYIGCLDREVQISQVKGPKGNDNTITIYGGVWKMTNGIMEPAVKVKLGVYSENNVGRRTLIESFITEKDGSFKLAFHPTTPAASSLFISEKVESNSRSESFLASLNSVHYLEYVIA